MTVVTFTWVFLTDSSAAIWEKVSSCKFWWDLLEPRKERESQVFTGKAAEGDRQVMCNLWHKVALWAAQSLPTRWKWPG